MGRLSGVVKGLKSAVEALEAVRMSRGVGYNAPYKPQRDFEQDYPNGAEADESGRLLFTIDGAPIGRGIVVGRSQVGGGDTGLPEIAHEPITERLTGKASSIQPLPKVKAGPVHGETVVNRYSGAPELIRLSDKLSASELPIVHSHEIGHAISQLAGEIPADGLMGELKYMYNDINNPILADKRQLLGTDDVDTSVARILRNFSPETAGYQADDVPQEYMAEAIRSYLDSPNYIKTVGPKTAARIREYVNTHPALKDVIQFNTVAGAAVLGGALVPDDAYAYEQSATDFTNRRQSKRDYWTQKRDELLRFGDSVANGAFKALDMPLQGYMGVTGAAGALAAGHSWDSAIQHGARIAQQPTDLTAYQLGGAVNDALSPYLPNQAAAGAGQAARNARMEADSVQHQKVESYTKAAETLGRKKPRPNEPVRWLAIDPIRSPGGGAHAVVEEGNMGRGGAASVHSAESASRRVGMHGPCRRVMLLKNQPHVEESTAMKQLSGMDNMFLVGERENVYNHVAMMSIYDVSTAPEGRVRFKDILKHFEDRLYAHSIFRRRLITPPFGIDRPYWIEDDDIDVEFHIRHIALPEPGDWRQLMIQIARLHSRPLDRRKPLWEAYVIEGLDNIPKLPKGSFAMFMKLHHSAVDGMAGILLAEKIHAATPTETIVSPRTRIIKLESLPSPIEMATRALTHSVERVGRISRAAQRTASVVAKLGREGIEYRLGRRDEAPISLPKPPNTRFNAKVSGHRVAEGFGIPLSRIKRVRQKMPGATLNDIFLSISGGAVHRYLKAKKELPRESLVALMPMSLRADASAGGNAVGAAAVRVRSDIADPVERLKAAHHEAEVGKQIAEKMGADLLPMILEAIPGVLSNMIMNATVSYLNMTVSNVRGPDKPLYLAGAKAMCLYPISIPTNGAGLNITGVSYNGVMWISAVSCRNMLPDPGFFIECMREEWEALLAVADALPDPGSAPAATARPAAVKAKPARTAKAKPAAAPKSRATAKTKAKPAANAGKKLAKGAVSA